LKTGRADPDRKGCKKKADCPRKKKFYSHKKRHELGGSVSLHVVVGKGYRYMSLEKRSEMPRREMLKEKAWEGKS